MALQRRHHEGTEERRLGVDESDLRSVEIRYSRFEIPKKSGGTRKIMAPEAPLKKLQRTILKRLLTRLRSHDAATGFERGRSIVTSAAAHRLATGKPATVSKEQLAGWASLVSMVLKQRS